MAKAQNFIVKYVKKKFVSYVTQNMIIPAATDVGRQAVKSMMVKAVNKKMNFDDELKVYTNNKKK